MRATLASWVEQADEPCPHCFHGYALHVQLHCVACDRSTCPICAMEARETRAIVCLECDNALVGAE